MSIAGYIVFAFAAIIVAAIAIVERRDKHAMKFGEWLAKNCYKNNDGYYFYIGAPIPYTTKEVYELFIIDNK